MVAVLAAAVAILHSATPASAQVTLRVKAASGTNLAAGASWTGGTAPISSTGAQWTSTSLGGALTLGSNQTWGLMDVQGATSNLSISGSQLTLASGNLAGTSSIGFNLPTAAGVDVTFANNVVIGGGQLWRVYSGRTLTVNGVVGSSIATSSATFTMIAQGGGTIALNGANTFLTNTANSWMRIDGGTTIRVNAVADGGVASPLGRGSATASQLRINGGTIDYVGTGHSTNRLFALTNNSTITSNGTGALAYTGTGNISYTTTANVASDGRILTLGGANANDNSFRPNLVNGTTASGLTKSGSGLWIVSGNNTYTGNTTVNAGTLVVPTTASLPGWDTAARWSVASGAALGVGNSFTDANVATLLATGNFLSGGSLGFSTAAANRTYAAAIADTAAGPLGLVKTQANTLTLSGTNTYTGNTQIATGTLAITTTAALPGWDTAGRFNVASGAMLAVGDAVSGAEVADLSATGNFATGSFLGIDTAAGDRVLSAPVVGAGGLRKSGANTLELAAANSYAGPTEISGGTVAFSGTGGLAVTSAVSLTGSETTFDIAAADGDRTIGSLTGGAGTAVNLGGNSLTVGDAASTTFSGGIGGSGGLLKTGAGTLTLSGTSTYAGGTTIRAGSVVASAGSATLGAGGVTLNDSQTGAANTAVTVNANLAYGVPLTVANQGVGTSTITFSGAVTSGAKTPFTSITLDRAATLDFQTSGLYEFHSPISGTGPLTIGGNNSYKIAGGSWAGYSGPVTIASGAGFDFRNRLGLANNTSELTVDGTMWVVAEETIGPLAGSGSVTTDAGLGAGTRSIIIGSGDGTGTFSGVIGQASAAAPLRITKTGTGTQTLSAANTFTGGSTIAAGTLALSGAGTLGGSTSPVALNGGRLDLGGTNQSTGAVTISAAAATGDTITAGTLTSSSYAVSNAAGNVSLAATLAGAAALTKTGGGTLTLGAASTFSGGTAINAGTVAANAASALGIGVTTVASAATLEIGHGNALEGSTLSPAAGSTISFNAASGTIYALGGLAGAGNLVATGNTLAVGGNNASTTYSAAITTDAITKQGAGTLTLSGSNSFQGGTIVSAGTLVVANSAALSTTSVTIDGGARMRLDSGSIIANEITNLGTGFFFGTLDFAGGGLARTSTAGGATQGTLLAGSSEAAASLNPAIAWLAQTSVTASDIMQLNNTSGTAQVLSLSYDPLLTPDLAQDAFLGWFDTGTTTWVNAIDGNSGGTGSFFQGSWSDFLAANPGATPTSALGAYGHDTATNSAWAVVDHNSDFAVIIVPEPGTLALAGLGLAAAAALLRRR